MAARALSEHDDTVGRDALATADGDVAVRRARLHNQLENLLSVNVLQQLLSALAHLRDLHGTCGSLLLSRPETEREREFSAMVHHIYQVVDRHIRPWTDGTETAVDERTRIEVATTILRLCTDLHSLAGLMHPDLRIRQLTVPLFAPAATSGIATLQGVYLP